MGRSAKKIDGRSKEARALRAKKLAKASPAPRKPRAVKTAAPMEVPFDRETSLRILALQIASNNIGRDTAPRDLVPLARQIEEFLNGVTPLAVGSPAVYAGMSAEALDREVAAQTLHDAEHAFD